MSLDHSSGRPERTPEPRAGDVVTRLPRWPPGPGDPPAAAPVEVALGTELSATLRRRARDGGVGAAAVLLAAHARVLGALTAEAAVRVCWRDRRGRAVSAALDLRGLTWRELVGRAGRLLAAAPQDDVRAEGCETLLDLTGAMGATGAAGVAGTAGMPGGAALRVAVDPAAPGITLTLAARADLMSAGHLGRIAGYHRAALTHLAVAPDQPVVAGDLLDAAERAWQLTGLAGPRRPRGTRMAVALFEEQARRRPADPAAAHGAARWSYRTLNRRANGIAHALLAAGLGAGDVVAVTADRSLPWAAAVLGVLKAGGVFLAVERGTPAPRVAAQLAAAGVRFAVVDGAAPAGPAPPGTAGAGPPAPTGPAAPWPSAARTVDVHTAGESGADPGIAVGADRPAYLYFTSGSTGTPKGALCAHGGLLNHLFAKIEDLGIGPGAVVAQSAAAGLDISLWQLLAPLLVGGTTQIIDTAVLRDVDRFVAALVAAEVEVAQVVPSYLDVLTRALTDRPRDLGRLRVLSVTGEPLRRDAARRWLAANPHIPLVNAYGATELSDDTMHEVLRLPPADDVVTVGRPLPNVGVYVVDDALRLRPLGAPGEIVFSGVAVGAGYVNDPERTRLAFTADPHHPGRRLYRTGDYGRWLPDGRLNFLGRRDQQVKIRGYRIELGEIESVLAGLPGVHSTAVVVVPGEGTRPAALAAFVAGPAAPDAAAATARIRRHLPDYMVPTYVHRLAHLPLTPNGKVDRAALRHLAGTLGHADGPYAAPTTPTERMLATAWAEVLHTPVERIGRADHFFHLGGNSLSAVWLVVRLHGAVSLAQVLRRPVLADLAAALDGAAGAPGPARDGRAAPAAPVPAPAPARTRRRRQPAADPLLHRLSAGSAARLVCFPYAGGNAVNFTALAAALARHDIAVYGVDPPGHDLTPDPVPLADPATIAAAVRRELAERTGPPLLLWGHGAGAAAALCLARLLGRGATPVRGLFVAAQALRPAGRLRHAAEAVAALSDRAVVDILRGARAYVSFDRLQDERAAIVGAAYRNDVRTAHLLLADAREDPAAHRIPVPLHVVVADDDPATPPSAGRYRGWGALATAVTLHRLPDGGHYFVRTRAAETAALVAAVGAARPGGTRRDGGTHGRR